MKKFKAIIVLIIALVLGLAFVLTQPDRSNYMAIFTEKGEITVKIEIASTTEEKARGLMFRDSLDENEGMLFVYEEEHPSIWMKNMLIPLDILFINENLQIIKVQVNVPPCEEMEDSLCPRYQAVQPVSFVLELPAYFVAENNVKVGDKIRIPDVLLH